MYRKSTKKAQVISFLSGKGGAGKTSIAIGVSYLLNDAGFKVLLIDFDFATNGASYFYKHLYTNRGKTIGLYELMNKSKFKCSELSPDEIDSISLEIGGGLRFIPLRVNFTSKLPLRDSIAVGEEDLKSLLTSLINFHKNDYDFIVIDNQAGSNLASKISANVSDKAIIVSELDPISSDAVDTLLIQIGDALPEYRRHLINKLDVSEIEDYKNLSTLFQSMNRLPPLPFDFDVRSAFASRRIPIDVNNPTTFMLALFNTVKAFLPEYTFKIDQYGQKILKKYNRYQDHVDYLLERKKGLENDLGFLKSKKESRRFRTTTVISVSGAYLGVALVLLAFLAGEFAITTQLVFGVIGGIIAIGSTYYLLYSRQRYKERTKEANEEEVIESELSEINKEIDRYRSLVLTRTKEFLLYFEKGRNSGVKREKPTLKKATKGGN